MHRKENFSSVYGMNVMQQVVAREIEDHAYCVQRYARRTKLKRHLDDRAVFIKILKG
jgi:6-phosphogluconate dehydrogenase